MRNLWFITFIFTAFIASFAPAWETASAETQDQLCFVPAGNFTTSTGVEVYLDAYWIGKYEVTNQQYCDFLNSSGLHDYYHLEMAEEIVPGGNYSPAPGFEQYPIRYVSPTDALAYCDWLSQMEEMPAGSYNLPTEAQWEKAAGWDPVVKKLWTYAFQSDAIDCSKANCNSCIGRTSPVGYYNQKSYYGCYDMTGNVWEWCSDYSATYPNGTVNPSVPDNGSRQMLRGGSWPNTYLDVRVARRNYPNCWPNCTWNGFRICKLKSRLSVQSIPPGVQIAGDTPGTTDLVVSFDPGSLISLQAPSDPSIAGVIYSFVRWIIDGQNQPLGQASVSFMMTTDRTAIAVYRFEARLSLTSTPYSGIYLSGSYQGMTPYETVLSAPENVTLSAQLRLFRGTVPYNFAYWKINGAAQQPRKTDIQLRVEADTTVEAVYNILGDANGDCVVNVLDLINIRNRLGKPIGSADNWRGDVNLDGSVNVLDLISTRNTLGTKCQ